MEINKSQKFAIFALTVFLLFISSPIAPDPPTELEITLDSAIKVTPEILNYDGMVIGVPRATTLTIANISENDILVTPTMSFGIKSKAFLDSKLEICNLEECTLVGPSTKIEILRGASQDVVLTVTLIGEIPEAATVAGDFQVTGEVLHK